MRLYPCRLSISRQGTPCLLLTATSVHVCSLSPPPLPRISEILDGGSNTKPIGVEGVPVFDRKQITQRYVRSYRCYTDIIAALPVELVTLSLKPPSPSYIPIFRLNRLLRLNRLFQYFAAIDVRMARSKTVHVSAPLRRMIRILFNRLMVCHWVACVWLFLGSLITAVDWYPDLRNQTWVLDDESREDLEYSAWNGLGYLRSIYFVVVGMSTVGYGDIIPQPGNLVETLYVTVFILFGGLMYPAVVGGVACLLENINRPKMMHKGRMDSARKWMVRHNLPDQMQNRIQRYYNYIWSRQGGINENDVLDDLPITLRRGVTNHILGQLFGAIPFFSMCDEGIILQLLCELRPRIFLPDELIIRYA